MVRKRFVIHRTDRKRKQRRIFFMISNFLLFLGSMGVISTLVYLLLHLSQSDALVKPLTPFVLAGVALVIVSQVVFPHPNRMRR